MVLSDKRMKNGALWGTGDRLGDLPPVGGYVGYYADV